MKSCMFVIWKTKCIIVNAIYIFYDDNIVFQLFEIFNLFGLFEFRCVFPSFQPCANGVRE